MTHTEPIGESSNRSFYNADSKTYDDQRWSSWSGAYTNGAQQRILQALCATWQNSRVVEIGSGTARFSIPLLRMQNRLTLVDISPEMLATAERKIGEARLSQGVDAYAEGSVYELPFDDNSFDHALSLNVFNHLERPGAALKELARVIRPGSTLLFNYANLQSYYALAGRRINRQRRSISQNVYSTWEKPAEVRQWIEQAGLKLVKQLGHVHVPRAMEKYGVLPLVFVVDVLSRRGILRRFAPYHFCLCQKSS